MFPTLPTAVKFVTAITYWAGNWMDLPALICRVPIVPLPYITPVPEVGFNTTVLKT